MKLSKNEFNLKTVLKDYRCYRKNNKARRRHGEFWEETTFPMQTLEEVGDGEALGDVME